MWEHSDTRDLFRIYREYLVHEDNLLNIRLNWLLIIQGFLFTAYGLTLKGVFGGNQESVDVHQSVIDLFMSLKCLGMTTSILSFITIFSSLVSLIKIRACWDKVKKNIPKEKIGQNTEDTDVSFLPYLVGGGIIEGEFDKFQDYLKAAFWAPIFMPIAFFMSWLYLLINPLMLRQLGVSF